MNNNVKYTILVTTFLCLIWSASAWAGDDAGARVKLGALAYEDFSGEFEAMTIYISRLTPPDNCSDEQT